MPDPGRIAQARPLEVPVTLQGSKIVPGTDQRELFTESATTTLVCDDGAVLNLKSRVQAGQSLFLRNEKTGREILVRVTEAPAEGESGPTDLEFTSHDPEFWGAAEAPERHAEEVVQTAVSAPAPAPPASMREEIMSSHDTAPVQAASGSQAEADASHDNPLAMMSAPASTATVPKEPARAAEPEEEEPPHAFTAVKEVLASASDAPEPPSEIVAHAPRDPSFQHADVPEFNPEKFEESLAALMAVDQMRPRRVASGQEIEAAKAERLAAAGPAHAQPGADGAIEGELIPPKKSIQQLLTTGKGAIAVQAAAGVVIVVCLGFIWHAVHGISVFGSAPPPPTIASKPAPAKGAAPAPNAAAVKSGSANGATPGPPSASAKAHPPVAVQAPGTKAPSASLAAVKPAPAAKSIAKQPAPAMATKPATGMIDLTAPPVSAKQMKAVAPNAVVIPAKIISRPQPTFPDWAKGLDVDGTVTIDAVIDERGNPTKMKVISGPHVLARSAERAVGLWLFEPALEDGKPVASHMTLTVEFQR